MSGAPIRTYNTSPELEALDSKREVLRARLDALDVEVDEADDAYRKLRDELNPPTKPFNWYESLLVHPGEWAPRLIVARAKVPR